MSAGVDALVNAYLAHHFAFRPVDASFMGVAAHDARLPDASPGAAAVERAELARLSAMLDDTPEGDTPGARLDRRMVAAQIVLTAAALDTAPRFANPAWYSGEAAFGIVALLLPGPERAGDDVRARLLAVPDFLAQGRANLAAVPRALTARARREAGAFTAFLRGAMREHPAWRADWGDAADAAAEAFDAFADAMAGLPDAPAPAATGRAYLETLMRVGHGLAFDADAALAKAEADFARLGAELVALAAANDPGAGWEAQIESLGGYTAASPDAVIDLYRDLHTRALAAAPPLVTPATHYALEYRWLPPYFAEIAQALYFLPYRSPPGADAGAGSVYWVHPAAGAPADYLRANAVAPVKIVHAVHHGSVGHHTQNARARAADSRLARIAGTDCALGLAMLPAGTMVEGWACYVQDLMGEVPGFYSPAERILLKQMERRNAASVLVDIRLHTGEWSPAEAGTFYADAGFAPARIEAEITRNIMLPATRLMYWLGIEAIRGLRARWRGDTAGFHDTLIGYGHVPVAWAGEEMARAGLLD